MVLLGPVRSMEELRAAVGTELGRTVSPPISRSDIRRFAIAVYWPETPPRLYWDEEYARPTRWQGIIAPQDFNPFAWPLSGPGLLPRLAGTVVGARQFNGGTEVDYGNPMRPGDIISATDRVVDVIERIAASGRLMMVIVESVWHNQRGDLVKSIRMTQLKVLPAGQGV